MSSVLDTLTSEQYAEVEEAVRYRRMERLLVERGLWEIVRRSLVRPVPIAAPGTGQEVNFVQPQGVLWEVLYVRARFTTSAVVATRTPRLSLKDADGNELAVLPGGGTIAASQTNVFTWTAGYGDHSVSATAAAGLPQDGLLDLGPWQFVTQTGSLDAGDAWTQITATVREWSPYRLVSACRSVLADLDSAGGIRYPGG